MKDLIVIGAGNPDVIKLIEDINEHKKQFNFIGFLESNKDLHGKELNGYEIIGDDSLLLKEFKNCSVVNNVLASLHIREKITNNLRSKYAINSFPSLIHPSNYVKYFNYGEGNIIYEHVSLGANSKISDFNILYYGSVLGHEASLGSYNLVAAGSIVAARTRIEDRVFISNGVTINLNLDIPSDVFIGIGSVVVKSIKDKGKYFGNPAKKMSIKNLRELLK